MKIECENLSEREATPKLIRELIRDDARRGVCLPDGGSGDQRGVDDGDKVGVGAVPGSSFFREPVNNLIRLHFAKREETLNEALNRLESMKAKMM